MTDRLLPRQVWPTSAVALALALGACAGPTSAPTPQAVEAAADLTLEATKTYDPSAWRHDERTLTTPIRFALPGELPVVIGNAGNHEATLRYRLGPAGELVTCRYKGGSDQAHPVGEVQISKGLRYLLAGCSNGTQAGATVEADYLKLAIGNGDSWSPARGAARTTIRVVLDVDPVERQIALYVTPTAALFAARGEREHLTVRAFDQFGVEVPVAGLGVQWVSTRPDVTVVADGPDGAVLTAATDLGHSVIVARSTVNPAISSAPLAARVAHLQPGVRRLADADVLYPPPPLWPDQTLEDVPGYALDGDDLRIGSFTLEEVLTRYAIEDDGAGGLRIRAPLVVRTTACDPADDAATLVVGRQSLDVSGQIVGRQVRGDWTLLDVEAVDPTAIYLDYDFYFDGPALVAQGLVSAERLAGGLASDGLGRAEPSPSALARVIPPGFERWNKEPCAEGTLSVMRITGLAPTIKPAIIPPVGGLRIGNGQKTFFMAYGGVRVEAGIRPELDIQASGTLSLDCLIGDEVRVPLGLSALTASTIDLSWTFQPRLRAQVTVAGGPRLNAFVLAQGTLTATIGVRYEDGQLHTSDPTIGEYNRFDVTWQYDRGLSATGLGTSQLDNDMYVDGRVGVVGRKSLNFQLGGAILQQVRRFVELAQRAGGWTDTIVRNFDRLGFGRVLNGFGIVRVADINPADLIVNGLGIADALLRLTQIAVVQADVPIELRQRWESARKILNEADASFWYADEHQIYAVESKPEVQVGLVDVRRFLERFFAIDASSLTINITTPPIELVNFYKGLQAEGNIQSRVLKGAGNTEPRFQVGDRLWLRVPGRFGDYTGALDFSGLLSQVTPQRATVHTETPTANEQVGELAYRGVQGGFHIFEGTVAVTASNVDYLNAGKELFMLGWNRMVALDTAGYLNSYSGYTFSEVDLKAPATLAITGEVGETARGGFSLTNASNVAGEPAPAELAIAATLPGLVVVPAGGTLGANTAAPIDVSVACTSAGERTGTLTITGRVDDGGQVLEKETTVAVTVTCVEVDCPLGAIPNPGGPTACACNAYEGWIVVPGTNTCQCDPNRGFTFDAASQTCLSCRDRDPSRPYYDTTTQQCTECPFGAIPNPTGVTACACDSSRGFYIAGTDSPNPDSCECAPDRPAYDATTDACQACPPDEPRYNPTTQRCEGVCADPALPFYNHASRQCEACPSATPTWNPTLGVCQAACPGGSGAGNDEPFTGSFELGAPSGVFTFSREHYSILDRMQVIYEGRVLHDTGCTSGSASVPIAYTGTATSVLVKVIPNCAGSTGTAWNFAVSCPQ